MLILLRGAFAAVSVAVLGLAAAAQPPVPTPPVGQPPLQPPIGQPPRPMDPRDFLPGAQDATRHLISEVEHLQGHLADLPGPKERELYRRTDAFLRRALHFQDGLKAGANREHLYRDFAAMDKELHELTDALRPFAQNSRPLQRDLVALGQADERLHFALSQGDAAPERGLEVLHRQIHALAAEAEEFHRAVHSVLKDDRHGAETVRSVEALAKAAEHLHKSLDKNATRDHIRRDFAAVDKAWHHVARHLNELPPREHSFLRARAQRLDAIHERVFTALGMEGERPRIVIPFDRRP